MPLERIVEQVLLVSDNDAAEVLFRQVAVGGKRKGSIAEAAQGGSGGAHQARGVGSTGPPIADGSGLARQTKVPADDHGPAARAGGSARASRAAGAGHRPAGGRGRGQPASRYFDDESLAGRGVVRGKTGTLRKVHSLAGLVRTRDGSVLVYAFLVNNPKNDYAAKVWLDRVRGPRRLRVPLGLSPRPVG